VQSTTLVTGGRNMSISAKLILLVTTVLMTWITMLAMSVLR